MDKGIFEALQLSRKGKTAQIDRLIRTRLNIGSKNQFGETALQVATRYGLLKYMQKLKDYGFSLTVADKTGNKLIHTAALHDNVDCLKYLIKEKPSSVNDTNNRDETALHLAIRQNNIACAKVLLENGANLQSKDSKGDSPIHVAVRFGLKKCLLLLLEFGASAFDLDIDKKTPVYWAEDLSFFEITRILKEKQLEELNTTLGVDTIDEYVNLLSLGSFKSFGSRIYLVGPFNVGKTTIAKLLVGDPEPEVRRSTDGIWIYLGRAGIDTDEKKWVFLKQESALNAAVQSLLKSKYSKETHYQRNKEPSRSEEPSISVRRSEKMETSQTKVDTTLENIDQGHPKPDETFSDDSSYYLEIISEDANNIVESSALVQEEAIEKATDEQIINLILQKCKAGNYKMIVVPVDIWDFGGQKVYYMTHQLFISSKGLFVLVFNGSIPIDKEIDNLAFLPGHTSKKTTAIYLLHWVNSILTFCRRLHSKDKGWFPKILLVATHKDKVEDPVKTQKELKASIHQLFLHHNGREHLQIESLFFVNARDKTDADIAKLRDEIVEISMTHPNWGDLMPTKFVPLELQLTLQVNDGKHILQREQVEKLNRENEGMSLAPGELEMFLKVQHSLGKLIYFDDDNLRNYVVIDPSYFIEVLRSIVTEKQFWPKEKNLKKIYSDLSYSGILEKSSLLKIWEQDEFKHVNQYENYIIDILIKLDILIDPKSSILNIDTDDVIIPAFYLVPCMVSEKQHKEEMINDKSISVAFRFDGDIIPPAIVYRFLGSMLALRNLNATDGKQLALYTDCCVVTIDNNNTLKVHVSGNRLIVSLINNANKSNILPSIASTIYECSNRILIVTSAFYSSIATDQSSSSRINTLGSQNLPFSTELAFGCGTELCFMKIDDIYDCDTANWICRHGKQHETISSRIWFPDKVGDEDFSCRASCSGLTVSCKASLPSDKQLRRIASALTPQQTRDLFIHMSPNSSTRWECLEHQYDKRDVDDLKFFALWECKENKRSQQTFGELMATFQDIPINVHILCPVLIDGRVELDLPIDVQKRIPDDAFLEELSHAIGNATVQLGIELELSVIELQCIERKHNLNLINQTREVLKTWKSRFLRKSQTKSASMYPVMELAMALQRVRRFQSINQMVSYFKKNPPKTKACVML